MQLPVELNGYPVVKSEAHTNCATIMVQRGENDFVVATWWPELKSAWMWGHYYEGDGADHDAKGDFNHTAIRNAHR